MFDGLSKLFEAARQVTQAGVDGYNNAQHKIAFDYAKTNTELYVEHLFALWESNQKHRIPPWAQRSLYLLYKPETQQTPQERLEAKNSNPYEVVHNYIYHQARAGKSVTLP